MELFALDQVVRGCGHEGVDVDLVADADLKRLRRKRILDLILGPVGKMNINWITPFIIYGERSNYASVEEEIENLKFCLIFVV